MLSKDQWQAEQERMEDERGDEQQESDYQRWLTDPEAQAEYERWLNSLDRELAQKVKRQLDDFDWLGMEERN